MNRMVNVFEGLCLMTMNFVLWIMGVDPEEIEEGGDLPHDGTGS